MGGKLAQILNNSCSTERSIELLFAIRQNNWMEEAPGTIGYSEAVGQGLDGEDAGVVRHGD
jgi:hypothetical protein